MHAIIALVGLGRRASFPESRQALDTSFSENWQQQIRIFFALEEVILFSMSSLSSLTNWQPLQLKPHRDPFVICFGSPQTLRISGHVDRWQSHFLSRSGSSL